MINSMHLNCAARSLVLVALLAPACKSERKERDSSSAPASSTPGPASATSAEPSGALARYRPDDGTAAGRALAVLAAVEMAPLDGNPACADYARNTSTLFTDLNFQLRRIRDRAAVGLGRDELGQLVAWLDARAGMLEQMARAKAMPDGELGRIHLELTGSVADLANAMAQAYGDPEKEPEPDAAVRLGNAAENFAAAVRALGGQCSESTTP